MKRSQQETELMNERHKTERETLKVENDANMRELQEIQVGLSLDNVSRTPSLPAVSRTLVEYIHSLVRGIITRTGAHDGVSPQNEKKMMLTQQENSKIKQRDEEHTQELRQWRADLRERKQVHTDRPISCMHFSQLGLPRTTLQ